MDKIRKGQVVTFKPEWSDSDDEKFTFVTIDDEEKGRVTVVTDLGWLINPTRVVAVYMIAAVRDA